MQQEHVAWRIVAGRPPGTPDHDRQAWLTWVERVRQSDMARARVQAEVLSAREQTAAPSAHCAPAPVEAAVGGRGDPPEAEPARALTSAPAPLEEAASGTSLRFRTVLRQAGLQWSHFRHHLMRLGQQDVFGCNFIVTVTHEALGLSRTYEAVHESGWLPEFQQDVEQGVFSPERGLQP